MYGVEKRFKMQLLLGLKGSPLVGAKILNFVTPELQVAYHRLVLHPLAVHWDLP